MSGQLRIGTSGYAYDEWKGVFYPEDLKARERLTYYSSRFPTVEINYTFRRFPSEETLIKWRDQVEEGFRFTLKANQRITHKLKLRDAAQDVSDFVERARVLRDKLGTILFQCPPYLRYDAELLGSFLSALPAGGLYAMEFRHDSWNEGLQMLGDAGIAWCVAETDEKAAGVIPGGPFAYLRLRKTDYAEADIPGWADRIRPVLADRDVWCYFKHEEHGDAPRFADALVQLLT